MKISPIVSLGASAVLGVGALFLGRTWMASQSEATETRAFESYEPVQVTPEVTTVPILVADMTFETGDTIEASVLRFADWPEDNVPEGALRSYAELEMLGADESFAKGLIVSGEPIMLAKLSLEPPRAVLSAAITPGYRAVAIRVTQSTGVAGFVLPGDRVDVTEYVELDGGIGPSSDGGTKRVRPVALLSDVLVLGIDQEATTTLEGAKVSSTVTLEVTPDQALMLGAAGQRSQVGLSLIGQKETKGEPSRVEAVAPARPRTARKPVTTRRAPAAPTVTAVRVINGDTEMTVNAPIVRAPAAKEETGS